MNNTAAMDTATIWSLVIGGLAFFLGVLNFTYWAWLARREVIRIKDVRVTAKLAKRDEPAKNLPNVWIHVDARFELVREQGHKDCYVRSVWIQLDKTLCRRLNEYFQMPSDGRVQSTAEKPWYDIAISEKDRKLEIGKPEEFQIQKALSQKAISSGCEEEIKDMVHRLEFKYKIGWTRATGNRIRWQRFPQKWWCNLIPDILWWRI